VEGGAEEDVEVTSPLRGAGLLILGDDEVLVLRRERGREKERCTEEGERDGKEEKARDQPAEPVMRSLRISSP